MAHTIKINGRNCRQLADEIAKIVGKSAHFNAYGYRLEFEIEDAPALKQVAEDASKHYGRIGKRALCQAAETIRAAIAEVLISESARLSWTK